MRSIKDKVVILGMGCSRFGERWDMEVPDLALEAYRECLADSGIDTAQIDAAWYGAALEEYHAGKSSIPIATALRLPYIPVTRVENLCASGTEAFRGAVYAVASGAVDIALAIGVEKLKDIGFGGLPQRARGVTNALYYANSSAPGSFAQLASAYQSRHGIARADLKQAMAKTSVKSHENGFKNHRAHLRRRIDIKTAVEAPMIAEPIGLYDCCGVSDGAACAIVTTPEIGREMGKTNLISVKAVQLAVSNGQEASFTDWDGSYIATTRIAAQRAYEEAGVKEPENEISMVEVHDCFSITEIVTLEDLQLAVPGTGWRRMLDGYFDAEGKIPCQIDGGLKCFGHPIGASGLRMLYEMYSQLLGRSGERQLKSPRLGLTHNLGGFPHQNISSVSIIGRYGE